MTITHAEHGTDAPVDNGVDSDALVAARTALLETPSAADFTWTATCEWQHGTFSRSSVHGFSGLGQDQEHKSIFTFDADHPECFASQDRGATPTELVLAALASCLTAGVASVAQYRQVQLRSVTATVQVHMNVLGVLGADPDVRNGFSAVDVSFDIDADASPEDISAIVAQSQKR